MASISGQSTSKIDLVDGFFTSSGGGTATPTPTLTGLSDTYGFANSITISNYASYTSPTVNCEVYLSGALIVASADVADTNGVLSWTEPAGTAQPGTRTVKVRVQEFGDFIQSAEVSDTYVRNITTFRYFRCRSVSSTGADSSGHMGVRDWRYTTATPTDLPSDMTSDVLPTPFVASAGKTYGSYSPWKAFDSSTSSWAWTLTATATQNWIQIDMGASYTMASGKIRFYSGSSSSHFTISGSLDGSTWTVLNDTVPVNKTNSDMPI